MESNPTELDELGVSALMHAAKEGFTECAKLIEWGTHINSVDDRGMSALYYAMVNSITEIMKMLLDNDANIAAVSPEDTALSLAITMQNISMVRDILESIKNEQLQYSWMKCEVANALILSLRKKSWEIAKVLIEAAGTDIKNEDARQENPLVVAFEMECPHNVIKLLIEQGIDKEGNNTDGDTPLLAACRTGNYEGVKILVQNGANLHAQNVQNESAFELARVEKVNITKDRAKIVETLIGLGPTAEVIEKIAAENTKIQEEIEKKEKAKKRKREMVEAVVPKAVKRE